MPVHNLILSELSLEHRDFGPIEVLEYQNEFNRNPFRDVQVRDRDLCTDIS